MKLNIQLFAGSCSIGTITETTDINTNQSTFTIPATLTTSGSTYNNDDAYMTLQWKYASGSDWTIISKKTFGIGQNTSKTKSWSLTLTHNADGTLENVNFRVKWYITSSTNGTSSTKTATPTTIPRASSIDSMNNATTQDYPTIKWTPKSSTFKYKVKYLSADGTTYVQSGLISPNQTTQYPYSSLQIPNEFFTNVKSSYTQTATAILYTYQSDGTTLIGQNSTTFTVTLISNAKPHVWIENITDVGNTPSGWNVLLKGKSKIRYDVKYYFPFPEPASATITSNTNGQNFSASATISSSTQTKQFTTSVLNTTGSNSISARVTDSRTRYTDATSQTYTVVDYSNPSISEAKAKRVNSSNVEDDNGTYLNITFKASITSVSNKNTNIFRVGYREKGIGSYTYKTFVNNDKTTYSLGNTYVDYRITDWTLNTNKQYDIIFEATDSFTTTSSLRQIDTGFDLMNFNTSGKAMAIGKVSEAGSNEELLEIALPTTYTKNININKSSGDVYLEAKRTDNSKYIELLVGSGGINRGLYVNSGWLMYYDDTNLVIPKSTILKKEVVVDSIRSKNMIDKSTIVAGSIDGTSTTIRLNTRQALWLPVGTYTCSCNNITSPFRYGIQVQNIGVPPLSTWPSSFIYDSGWKTDTSFTFTITNAGWCTLMISKENNATLTTNEVSDFNFQLEKGSTATTYYPYQNLDGQEVYSTGEIKIGTWIDGKPLYRKVVIWSPNDYINKDTIKSLAHGISNLNEVCICNAIANWNNKFMPLTTHYQNQANEIAINTIDSSNINFTSYGENWGATKITFILEYTKTTD